MPRLTFDLEGFLMTNLLGSSWTRWQDVNRFRSTVGVIAFVNASRPKGFLGLDNSHCFLPSLYQLKSREISRLMTAWRERALMPWSKASTARDD